MTEELKPCPFCGSNKITIGYLEQPARYFITSCLNCGAHGPKIERHMASDEYTESMIQWNRRAEAVVSKMESTDYDIVKKFFEDAIKILDEGLERLNNSGEHSNKHDKLVEEAMKRPGVREEYEKFVLDDLIE